MADTETQIVNGALTKLGGIPIGSLDDQTKHGRLAKRDYPRLRDELIHEHHWRFATKRTSIAASVASPEWGFDFAYNLPSNCAKLLEVNGEDINYLDAIVRVEGGQVLTNLEAPLEIQYLRKEATDAGNFSPIFRQALEAKIASEWAIYVTGDPKIQANMVQLAREKLAKGKSIDSQEGTPKAHEANAWILARL